MTVMIGVDPHKGSHTAVAVDAAEQQPGRAAGAVRAQAARAAAGVGGGVPERTWAVENATGLGHLLAQQLVAAGERVLDVQPKLAARVRLLATESTNKNDPHDALSVAVAALRSTVPKEVRVEDHAAVHEAVGETSPGPVQRPHPGRLPAARRAVRPRRRRRSRRDLPQAKRPCCWLASSPTARSPPLASSSPRSSSRTCAASTTSSRSRRSGSPQVVAASGTTITDIFGVGPFVAATVVGVTGDIARFPTRDRFAAFNGTAPIEVSSGGRKVCRLSRRGNRTPQPRHPHGRRHPDPLRAQPRPRLLRPQDRRRQDTQGSAARAQAPHQRRPLGRHGRRRPTRRRTAAAREGGPGRATGERLCRQRGRLTPRYTGSSAKPLPNPTEGYDHQDEVATHDAQTASQDPKNSLTNKEDSIWAGRARQEPLVPLAFDEASCGLSGEAS